MAEQDDLPSGPCNTGVTLVRVARCVEGVWQLGWANPEELASATAVALNPILAAVEKKGWKPADVIELAKVLKGKPCT
jgi:hypothetical protein